MITKAKIEDAEEIFELHTKSVHEISGRSYPSEIIESWQQGRNAKGVIPFIQNDHFYIYKNGKNIDGFVHFVEDEICGLYVKADKVGQGIGAQLFKFAINKISSRPVKVQSTLNAIKFYKRMGCRKLEFDVQRRNDRDIYILNMEFT